MAENSVLSATLVGENPSFGGVLALDLRIFRLRRKRSLCSIVSKVYARSLRARLIIIP